MININDIKKTFAIYHITNNKLKVQLQYKNETYTNCFETEEECIDYQKDILGEEEYKKREIESFNRNFKKHIKDNNLPDDTNKQKIWDKICELFKGIGNDNSRKSHIIKEKTITLCDVYMQLELQEWKCYYSRMDFNLTTDYLNPSIDRNDSTLAYHKDNIVITIAFIQFFKNAYSLEEFIRGVRSISTGILDETWTKINSLIGGGPKKGIKSWKQVDLSRPIHMGTYQYYIHIVLKNTDEYLSRSQIEDKVKESFEVEVPNKAFNIPLKKLEESGYLKVYKNYKNKYKYKLKSTEEIRKINDSKKIQCCHCKKLINISDLRARDARGDNKLDLNLYHTICTPCNTASTTRYKNKDLCTFILRQISGRTDKKGDITKENFYKIKGSNGNCAISGLPLLHETDSGKFNQASPDRIINEGGKYNLDNVQIVCLVFNLAKKSFNITNECMLDIIHNIYRNIDNF